MSLDFYEKKFLPSLAKIWFVLCLLAIMGWQVVWCGAAAQADDDCKRCPPGSRGHIARGYWTPECICEVAR